MGLRREKWAVHCAMDKSAAGAVFASPTPQYIARAPTSLARRHSAPAKVRPRTYILASTDAGASSDTSRCLPCPGIGVHQPGDSAPSRYRNRD
jgi:hypothetical protein